MSSITPLPITNERSEEIERLFRMEKSKYRNDSDLVLFSADGTVDQVRGYGWPAIMSGKIQSGDYNVDWEDKDTRLDLIDQMLFGDPHTGAIYLIPETSIKSANWEVEPAKADDKPPDQMNTQEAYDMHAERARWNLFEGMLRPFTDWLTEIATMIAYGSALFEEEYLKDDEGLYYWNWFHYRPQSSIEEWITKEGQLDSVLQKSGTGDNQPDPQPMKANNLLLFTHRRWGMDFECGNKSIYRNCGKPWKMKQDAEVLAMMHYMRFGVGIPTLGWDPDKVKMGITGDNTMMVGDRQTADTPERLITMLKGVQAHHQNYFLEGPYKFRVETGNGISVDILNFIHYCKEAISQSAMFNMMNLGSGGKGGSGGNRALGHEFKTWIINSINSIIKGSICATINRHAIPQMINLNWSGVRKYPKLIGNFSSVDLGALATQVKALTDAGLRDHVDKVFWEYILQLFNWKGGVVGLPEPGEDVEVPDEGEGDEEKEKPGEPKKTEPKKKEGDEVIPEEHPAGEGKDKDKKTTAHRFAGIDPDYKTWRKIKHEERFVAFERISKGLDDYRSDLTDIVDRYRNRQIDAVKKQISKMSLEKIRGRKRIITANDLKELDGLSKAVQPLLMKVIKRGSSEVQDELKRMEKKLAVSERLVAKYQLGDEMTDGEFSLWLGQQIEDSTADSFIVSTLGNARMNRHQMSVAAGDNPVVVADYVAAELTGMSRNAREVTLGMFINEAFGFGREAEFFNQNIKWCQRSAVNDDRVCEVCGLKDGDRVRFRSGDYYYLPDTKNCLGSALCRCIWFMFEEEGK